MHPVHLLGWRAYYADGGTVNSSEVETWQELPAGVVGIVEFLSRPYRRIVDGGDHYWMEGGRWRASETVREGWVERPRPAAIRSAPTLPDEAWESRRREMLNDRRWPEAA